MTIGEKIKEKRTNCQLTQKELAEKLNVSYQAISRWENNEVEPSIDTIKNMAGIFECSIDDLFDMSTESKATEVEPEPIKETIVEHVVVQETKPVLAVCEKCNKPIFEGKDICRVEKVTYTGMHKTREVIKTVLCPECNNKRLQEEKRQQELAVASHQNHCRTVRIHAFVWPTLAAIILAIISATQFTSGQTENGIYCAVAAGLAFTFISCLIFNNTFINEWWLGISSWSIHFPGVIFELSLDGILDLLLIKLAFAVIGFFVSILAVIFATVFCAALSVLAYPFALVKNIKCEEDDYL